MTDVPFRKADTWQWTEGGKVLYENCWSCGGLLIEFHPGTVRQHGRPLDNPHFIVCTLCETPADVAVRLDWDTSRRSTGEQVMEKLMPEDYA